MIVKLMEEGHRLSIDRCLNARQSARAMHYARVSEVGDWMWARRRLHLYASIAEAQKASTTKEASRLDSIARNKTEKA